MQPQKGYCLDRAIHGRFASPLSRDQSGATMRCEMQPKQLISVYFTDLCGGCPILRTALYCSLLTNVYLFSTKYVVEVLILFVPAFFMRRTLLGLFLDTVCFLQQNHLSYAKTEVCNVITYLYTSYYWAADAIA